jgi:hypothetical protein
MVMALEIDMSGSNVLRGVFLSFLIASGLCAGCRAATKTPVPAAVNDAALAQKPGKQTAVFAGGCFWGTQSVFERVKGVVATTAGYAGGSGATATYDQVTTETTGHAESVRVVYEDYLWATAARFLLRRSRSDANEPARAGRGNVLSVRDLLYE